MSKKLRIFATIAILAAGAMHAADADATSTPQLGLRERPTTRLLIRGATIVVSPERTIEEGALLIEDGRVVEVGRRIREEAGTTVLELDGRTIYPGFIDPYTEYGLDHVGAIHGERSGPRRPQYEGDREGGRAWNDAIHVERRWVESFQPDAKAAKKLRKRGVTTVGSIKMDGILRGRGFVASLGEGLPNDLILRADGEHFASFDKGSSRQNYPSSLMGSIALLRQSLLDARWYGAARDADVTMPEYNAALEALHALDGPIVFETNDELTLLRAQRIAEEFDLELVHLGSNLEYLRLDAIAELGRPLILPLDFPERPKVDSFEEQLDVTLADLRHWERAPANPGLLASRGVPIAFTGHEIGDQGVLANVRKAIEHGLSEAQALAALTTEPAKIAGVDRRVGARVPHGLVDAVEDPVEPLGRTHPCRENDGPSV